MQKHADYKGATWIEQIQASGTAKYITSTNLVMIVQYTKPLYIEVDHCPSKCN